MEWSRTHGTNRTVEVRKDKDMKYPMINKQPRREVNVPELSGGLNLRDSLTGVRDNQMTDCVNMWYKDGRLRTRPAFVTNEEMKNIVTAKYNESYVVDIKTYPDVRKGQATLASALKFDGYDWDYRKDANIYFWWQYDDKIEKLGIIDISSEDFMWDSKDSVLKAIETYSYFVAEKDGVAYCYASNGVSNYINKLDYANGATEWEKVSNSDYYIPTVMAHCKRSGLYDYTGTQFEGYNMLTGYYKMIYSAYNENDSINSHPMRYGFVEKIAANGVIRATLTYVDENEKPQICVHEADASGLVDNDWVYEDKVNDDGLKMYVCKNYLGFSSETEPGNMPAKTLDNEADKKKYGLIEDNLIIEVNAEKTENQLKKIFGMTQNIWFGGAANGINGGSRLFLCGNTDENERSLVVWSALNNPLYFPENNYAYVGDKSQGVTAFGQQGENLIIFKEKSSYYSYYTVNNNITAEALINQSVVDYEANSAIFPMIQLNASVGCDCPDTVQLCRNRLVWANSDGNVYTLCSNNQYSERTIFKVSDMVSTALNKENDLKNAISCDFEGHYLLCVGNRIYVMDYNSYGYQYVSSYSKTEDSNALVPWYIWEFDNGKYGEKIFAIDNSLMIARNFQTDSGVTMTFSTLLNAENNGCDLLLLCDSTGSVYVYENKIKSIIKTKLFDFSAAGYLKNVDRVSIAFGNNGGDPISVNFVSDAGCENESVMLAGSATDERDAAFMTAKNFYPGMKSVRTFGVKIECEGPLIVDGLSLQYRLLGSVK